MSTQRQIIDLSHTIEDGMITYKGLPGPVICDYLSREDSRRSYAEGTEFQIGKIEMVANTGTYVDSPLHRFADGKDLSALPLTSLADLEVEGKAVLVHTGWDRHWRSDQYFEGHPFLTADAAEYLADDGAALVGIDSLNIDDTADKRRPVHTALLRAEVPIAEHLRGLDQIPTAGFKFFAVPAKVRGVGTFPVRAFALVG